MINGYVRTFKLKLTCRQCKILHCIALAKTVMSKSLEFCFIEALATFNPQGNMWNVEKEVDNLNNVIN